MGQKPALAFILILASACGRSSESHWEIVEPRLGLGDGIEVEPWSGEPLVLRRVSGSESTVGGILRIVTTARQRGRAMSMIVTARAVDLDLESVPMETSDGSDTLLVNVSEASVSLDPPLEGEEERQEEAFDDVALRVIVDERNRQIGLGDAPGGCPEGETQAVRDITEALKRVSPEFPEKPVTTGDSWESFGSFVRPLPGGGEVRVALAGRNRFIGRAAWDGREVAVLGAEYRVTAFGRSRDGGFSGEVTGDGQGRALFLVEPSSGIVVRAQATEATLLRVELAGRGDRRIVEQYAESEFDWRIEE